MLAGVLLAEAVLARVLLEQRLEVCYWKTLQEYVADVKHAYAPHIDVTTDIDEVERQQMENLLCKFSKQKSNCSSAFLNSASSGSLHVLCLPGVAALAGGWRPGPCSGSVPWGSPAVVRRRGL